MCARGAWVLWLIDISTYWTHAGMCTKYLTKYFHCSSWPDSSSVSCLSSPSDLHLFSVYLLYLCNKCIDRDQCKTVMFFTGTSNDRRRPIRRTNKRWIFANTEWESSPSRRSVVRKQSQWQPQCYRKYTVNTWRLFAITDVTAPATAREMALDRSPSLVIN